MLRLLAISIFLCSLFFTAYSQPISKIDLSGNNYFSRNELLNLLDINLSDSTLDYNNIKNNLFTIYQNEGYFDAIISVTDSTKDSTRALKIYISEGLPALIKEIKISGFTSNDSLIITKNFVYLENQFFTKIKIEDAIKESLRYLENSGYPFAKFIISSFTLGYNVHNKRSVSINIVLDYGMKSSFNNIEVTGNTKTKDYVIVRELRLPEGAVYKQEIIEEIPRRLNRLRFFEPVKTPTFLMTPDYKGILKIDITEKETNSFDGIIGYVPGAVKDEKGYITGLANISLRNLFGTGRAFQFRWQQLNRFTQELELKYIEPWIFNYPFNISTTLLQKKQDTTYVQRRVSGTFDYLTSQDITASLLFNYESVIPNNNDSLRYTVFNSSTNSIGANILWDTRDDPYAPLSGVLFNSSFLYSTKKISGPERFITSTTKTNVSLQRLSFNVKLFYELFKRQVLAFNVLANELRGDQMEESDLFRLGGATSLRGYREDQFRASRILLLNSEYRLLLTRRSFAFVFFDWGYFLRKEDLLRNILQIESNRAGYGLGMQVETGLGVLSVSYALGKGDTFTTGKIHFGIINDF